MTTVAEFAWQEQKRLYGVSGNYQLRGESDVPLTVVVAEGSGLFEHKEENEKIMRKAIIDCDASQAISSRGRITVGNDVWQIYSPAGRDAVVQSWNCIITVQHLKR